MRPRAAPGPGIGTAMVFAPQAMDRFARDQARFGECVLLLRPGPALERGADRTEDSGP